MGNSLNIKGLLLFLLVWRGFAPNKKNRSLGAIALVAVFLNLFGICSPANVECRDFRLRTVLRGTRPRR